MPAPSAISDSQIVAKTSSMGLKCTCWSLIRPKSIERSYPVEFYSIIVYSTWNGQRQWNFKSPLIGRRVNSIEKSGVYFRAMQWWWLYMASCEWSKCHWNVNVTHFKSKILQKSFFHESFRMWSICGSSVLIWWFDYGKFIRKIQEMCVVWKKSIHLSQFFDYISLPTTILVLSNIDFRRDSAPLHFLLFDNVRCWFPSAMSLFPVSHQTHPPIIRVI